jgi:hypothetical protein
MQTGFFLATNGIKELLWGYCTTSSVTVSSITYSVHSGLMLTALPGLALMVGGPFVPYTLNKGDSMEKEIASACQSQAKFILGRIVATPNALNQIPNNEILNALSRHVRGDWGELDPEDREANEHAVRQGERFHRRPISPRGPNGYRF